jgi:PKD repeat protein
MLGQDYFNDLLTGGYNYSSNPGSGTSTDHGKEILGSIIANGMVLWIAESSTSSDINTMKNWTLFGDCALRVYGEVTPPDPPVADFSADTLVVAAGGSVSFTDLSTNNPTSWDWTFEGGTPSGSTAQNPTVTYNTPGTYDVSLTAANSAGSDSETKVDYITVTAPQPPVADFTASSTSIYEGQSVDFTDTSTNGPTSWDWTFAGGTPGSSTAQNPTVTYNTAGTYTVSLTATNVAGSDTETKNNYITVSVAPIEYCTSSGNNQNYEYIAGVQVADLNNTSGASGYTDFTSQTANLTAGASTAVSLTPGFTGSSYTEWWKIWIDYNIDGDFEDAGEEVFRGSGSSPVSGNFTVPGTASGLTRMRVSMSYSTYPPYCGTFTYGEVEDYTVNISGGGGDPPVADFSASATTITEGQTIDFTDLSTNTPTSWSWTFNGGTPSSSTAQNPSVTYNIAGTYTVELTATNAYGSDTETKVNYITVNPPAPPVADFTASSTTITEGQSVDFTDLSTNNPTSWSWTFYGGTPSSSTAQNPTVTYNTAGTYTVELTATNSGGSDDEIKSDYITVNPAGGITFETGTLSNVGSTWQTVTLQNTYTSMVVVCSTGLDNSSTLPAVVRVRNASGNSFDVKVQNPGDGSALSGYPVHYFVVEEGVYTEAADGVKMEAVKVNSTVTARQGSWVLESRSYQNSYSSPVVLGQVMTNNDADWSVFWACAARTSPPSSSNFNGGKHVGEDSDTTRVNETIGYVVFEQGSGTINSTPFRAAVGSDIVKGPGNTSIGYTYTFSSVPNADVAIVSAAGMDGGNGGWPVMYGSTPLTSTSLTMVFDEDQVRDSERNHVNEQVAYIVFGQ